MKKEHKIIISVAVIIAVGIAVFFFFDKREKEEVGPLMVKVSGVVLDFSNAPVSGVDLVVGDTSIRIGESGRFVFTNVSTDIGIRLTHPELLRAIAKLPETREDVQTTNVLFDVPLYNSLITIIDLEARGHMMKVYDHLAQEVQNTLSFEVFNGSYQPLFIKENITDQEIVIKSIRRESNYYARDFEHRFKEMVEFEIINDSNAKWYKLVLGDSENGFDWRLIP